MAIVCEDGVYQMESGYWAYRFSIVVDGKRISRKKTTDEFGNKLKSKKQAAKAREAAIRKVITESQRSRQPAARRLVKEVFAEYCQNGRKDRAYATIRKQDSLWNNHIRSRFGERYVDEISVAEIVDYLSELYYVDGLSYMYVESFLKMFYLIFGQAYSRNYLDVDIYNKLCVNRDTKIHMPKLKAEDDTEIVSFSREELAQLDNYFKGTNAETAYMLGRYCGLRINECYGLKWENVDLEKGTIFIDRQMQYQDGVIKLVEPKTINSKRLLYMNDTLKAYFIQLAQQHKLDAERYQAQRTQKQVWIEDFGGGLVSSLELVNSLPNGKIQTVNSMKFHSRSIKERLGIDFKFHHLRHTYGTIMAELNTPAHLLQNQMGHSYIHVTQRYYIAVSKAGIDILQGKLNQL